MVKKKQRKIDSLKREVSKHIKFIEEERREKKKWERKAIQFEENYKVLVHFILKVNEELERQIEKNVPVIGKNEQNEKKRFKDFRSRLGDESGTM